MKKITMCVDDSTKQQRISGTLTDTVQYNANQYLLLPALIARTHTTINK
jgi:hypothetical protein